MGRGDIDFFMLDAEEEKRSKKKKIRPEEHRVQVTDDTDFFGIEETVPGSGKKFGIIIAITVFIISLAVIVCVLLFLRSRPNKPVTQDPDTDLLITAAEETQEIIAESETHFSESKENDAVSEEVTRESETPVIETQEEVKKTEETQKEVKKVPLDKNTNLLIKAHRMCLDMTQTYLLELLSYYDQDKNAENLKPFPDQAKFKAEIDVVLQGILDHQVLSISEDLKQDLYFQSERIVGQAMACGKEAKEIKVAHYNEVVDVYNALVGATNETNDLLIAYFDENNIDYTVTFGPDGVSRQVSYSYSEY